MINMGINVYIIVTGLSQVMLTRVGTYGSVTVSWTSNQSIGISPVKPVIGYATFTNLQKTSSFTVQVHLFNSVS